MSDPKSDDPLSLVYEGLWKLVEDFEPFKDAVREGNRIRLDGRSRNPMKANVQAADLPEVILHPQGGESNLHANSSESRLTRRFAFLISTGDMRIDYLHFPLQWHVLRALTNWKEKIGELVWKGHAFLVDVNMPDTQEGESDPDRNRNIKGWSSIVTIETVMEFPTRLLRTP